MRPSELFYRQPAQMPWLISLLCGCLLWFSPIPGLANENNDKTVRKFLESFCADCHAGQNREGERNFDGFSFPIESKQDLLSADEIIDQLTLKQMPPEESDQPSDEVRLKVLDALRSEVTRAAKQMDKTGARTVIRRLSNREYENTLATLFDRRVDTLGLTADFPKENTSENLDNIGKSLVTSGFLLDQYFRAASRLVESRLAKPEMEPQSWHFTKNFRQYEELSGPHRSVFNYKYLCLYEQPNTDTRQGGYGHIEDFLQGVPVSGLYDIKVLAQAMHRDTHYDPKIFRIDFSEPFQLAVVTGDVTKGHIHYPQPIEPILGKTVVPDKKPEWLSFRVWLEAGQTPRFIFPNGPYESRASVIETNRRYKDEFKNPKDGVSRSTLLREGKLPHIRISEIKIDGPVKEKGGSREELAVFGSDGFQETKVTQQLFSFAKRAFRRPLEPPDRKRIQGMFEKRISQKATPRQAALDTVKMILCSPSFLYFREITPEKNVRLNDFDLASRLSYALWAAPPDDKLFAAALAGKLTDTDQLKAQIHRHISDPRSDEFIHSFLDSWLNLRTLGDFPPPRKSAWEYYAQNLPASMKQETRLMFRHLLHNNGSINDLLEANYTFVDKSLAKHYRLPEASKLRFADGFRKVKLDPQRHRGGLLGMASVLTVSANGVETSPVTRGVWVSENILGVIPPPPPDVVPSIEADVRGAKTIREKLAKHREDKACFVCHRNIDPLGFPLENFDPVGRWRVKYPKPRGKSSGAKIDSSGKLPSGEEFKDFAAFKQVLLQKRRDLFARNLIEKLLSYSTGRHMEEVDRPEVKQILERVKADNYGLKTLVVEVLTSDIFRSR